MWLIGPTLLGGGHGSSDAGLTDFAPGTADDVFPNSDSIALDLTSPEGIAGTVGVIFRQVNPDVPIPPGADPVFSSFCTGTLIHRKYLLTAGHCIDKDLSDDQFERFPSDKMRVMFPQQDPSFEMRGYVNLTDYFEVDDSFGTGWTDSDVSFRSIAKDVAVLRLSTEVPPSIVSTPAIVSWGDLADPVWPDGTSADLDYDDAWVVGAGRNYDTDGACSAPAPIDCAAGQRRVAKLDGLDTWQATSLVPDESPPNDSEPTHRLVESDLLRSSRPSTSGALSWGGDSGGPVFIWDREKERYLLVGVHSSSDRTAGYNYHAVVAELGGTDNGAELLEWMGQDDIDGDGIVDIHDNCPAWRCPDWMRCRNPEQVDVDGDGVGDACDNCAPSRCDALEAHLDPEVSDDYTCTNPSQQDTDGDGIGDTCDLCPNSAGDDINIHGVVLDADSDGVGDACDDCEGLSPRLSCMTDSDCSALGFGFEARCINDWDPEAGAPGRGHCDRLEDLDRDGIPDACDGCLNDDRNVTPSNSNADVELALAAEQGVEDWHRYSHDDVCDPVPLAISSIREPVDFQQGYGQPAGDYPFAVERLDLRSWVGSYEKGSPSAVFGARIAFRHCACIDRYGNPSPAAFCVETCNPVDARAAEGTWLGITVSIDGTSVDPQQGMELPFWTNINAFSCSADSSCDVEWDWLGATQGIGVTSNDPAVPPQVSTLPVEMGPNTYIGTHGMFAAAVVQDLEETELGAYYPTPEDPEDPEDPEAPEPLHAVERSGDYFHPLTAAMELLSTPNAAYVRRRDGEEWMFVCEHLGCVAWIFPWMERIYPGDLRSLILDPSIVVADELGQPILHRRSSAIEVDELVDPIIGDMLLSGEWAYLPARDTAQAGNDLGVLVPRAGSPWATPVRVHQGETMELLDSPVPVDAANPFRAALPNEGAAFYSAAEAAVYFAGGTNGVEPGSIRRFSLTSGRWSQHIEAGLEGVVLSIGRLQSTSSLYALSLIDGEELMLVERNGDDTKPVWSAPWTGAYSRAVAHAAPDGSMLLAATDGQSTQVWRWKRQEGEWSYGGALTLEGELLDHPVTWTRAVWLPLRSSEGLSVRPVSMDAFDEEVEWNGL